MKKVLPDVEKVKSFNQYISAIKIISGIVVTFIVTTWGVFKYMDKRADEKSKDSNNISMVLERQDKMIEWMITVDYRLDTLTRTTEGVSQNIIHVGNYVERVKNAFYYHIQKSPEVTKEDYALMMELIMDVKKNSNTMSQTKGCE